MTNERQQAPPLQVTRWFNTEQPIELTALRGKVVVLHAFQMLCPGCVSHGIPQAVSVRQAFPADTVVVLGLHTVFEHHDVMGPDALAAFIHEYRLTFPIGVDTAGSKSPLPLTMQAYGLQGTPSLVLIDKAGTIRLNHFGRMDDMRVGALIGHLLTEAGPDPLNRDDKPADQTTGCDDNGCRVG